MVSVLLASVLLLDQSVWCQGQRLPQAGFSKYSSRFNIPRRQTVGGSGIETTPGLHLTPGESRTKRNYNKPYNPGEPSLGMKWTRWSREKMPLRIWISPGLQLPGVSSFQELQSTRVEYVYKMLRDRYPLNQLPVARGWTPEVNFQVASGIEQWRIFQQEGLLSFGFTTNPYDAHIVVFFTDNFQGTTGPGGIIVGANTSAQLFTPQQIRDPRYRQKPVVMEFSLSVNHEPEKLQGASAHEFGHALGIKAHSPYREDIMYRDRIVNQLSEGDKSTLRLLYKTKTPFLM